MSTPAARAGRRAGSARGHVQHAARRARRGPLRRGGLPARDPGRWPRGSRCCGSTARTTATAAVPTAPDRAAGARPRAAPPPRAPARRSTTSTTCSPTWPRCTRAGTAPCSTASALVGLTGVQPGRRPGRRAAAGRARRPALRPGRAGAGSAAPASGSCSRAEMLAGGYRKKYLAGAVAARRARPRTAPHCCTDARQASTTTDRDGVRTSAPPGVGATRRPGPTRPRRRAGRRRPPGRADLVLGQVGHDPRGAAGSTSTAVPRPVGVVRGAVPREVGRRQVARAEVRHRAAQRDERAVPVEQVRVLGSRRSRWSSTARLASPGPAGPGRAALLAVQLAQPCPANSRCRPSRTASASSGSG